MYNYIFSLQFAIVQVQATTLCVFIEFLAYRLQFTVYILHLLVNRIFLCKIKDSTDNYTYLTHFKIVPVQWLSDHIISQKISLQNLVP